MHTVCQRQGDGEQERNGATDAEVGGELPDDGCQQRDGHGTYYGQRAVALRDERVAEMQSAINELTESLTKKDERHQRRHHSRTPRKNPGDGKHGPPEGG